MPNHATAQETAEKIFLPEEMDDLLDDMIKKSEKKVSDTKTLCKSCI
jgi:hypothetical protein